MLLPSTLRLQVRNNYCIVYTQADYFSNFSPQQKFYLTQNFKEMKTYSGTITKHTQKRINRACDMLLQLSPEMKKLNPVTNKVIKHRLSFITLTISETKKMLTAKQAYKKLLAPFLRYFRDTEMMTTYIWKAELQKRGQIHYHITTPSIIPHDVLRKNWNKQQQKAGLLKDYFKIHNHYNPNSTDIHKVQSIKDFGAYLAKEFCKTVQNETPTSGKLWDCSLNIKGAKYYSTDIDIATAKNILNAHKLGLLKTLELEKCTVIKLKHMKSYSLLTPVEKKSYNEYLNSLSNKRTTGIVLPASQKESTLSDNKKLNQTTMKNNDTTTKCIMEKDEPCNPEYDQRHLCKLCPHKQNNNTTSKQLQDNRLLAPIDRNIAQRKMKTKRPI